MDGWIKLHRSILDWEWYGKPYTQVVFIHCLLKANIEDGWFQGVRVPRGSFITSVNHIATETGLSRQNVRTALNNLQKSNEINQQGTNRYTLITLNNYEKYQAKQPTNQPTEQPTNQPQYKKKEVRSKNMYTDQRIYDYDALQKRLANK